MPEHDAPETEAGFAHWDQKPALGRRGMILAVVVPVLIAAAAFGVVSLVSEGSETAATAIKVPTNSWIAGQPSGSTPIQGTLAVDSRRCVYLDGPDGEVWPVWPAGFRARLDSTGKVSLYDGADHLVARDGEGVRATGVLSSPTAFAGETCLPSDDEVAVVQSEVTRVG
ncbi:hypothetical protein [Nocardioides sp. URHA0020]|uniref:hypothetical protein n=1 Tax=Nocardioides sp. URHA0020 TaxID=1380392 RepID=UPI00048B424A|nr:hypothetical protein [Nocardioides sp. URHA0020]